MSTKIIILLLPKLKFVVNFDLVWLEDWSSELLRGCNLAHFDGVASKNNMKGSDHKIKDKNKT